MSITHQLSSSELEERSIQLRSQLKQWERDFATSHNGRKAGREDIKQHPDIASKYKSYDKLRQSLSQPAQAKGTKASPVPNKRRLSTFQEPSTENALMQTPSKKAKHAHPLHSQPVNAFAARPLHPALLDPYDAPISSLLSPSKARTSLGPTPQKNGKVLGLFDILSSGSIDRTPSKRKILDPIGGNGQHPAVTPSKHSTGDPTAQKLPGSASKGQGLSTVFTPASHRVGKINPGNTPISASGVRKLKFDDTPAFLRRDSQRAVTGASFVASQENGDEDEEDDAVVRSPIVPWRTSKLRRPPAAGRGLSALVRGLRELEDERLDDEMDLLREMEGGDTFESFASKMSNQAKTLQPPKILVGDSQAPEMPLGPDGGVESEEDALNDDKKTRDGLPVRTWKKRGQKRTTRAVKMRPNTAKWKAEPAWKNGAEFEDDEEGENVTIVETQGTDGAIAGDEAGAAAQTPSVDDDEYAADPEGDEDVANDDVRARTASRKGQKKDEKRMKADGKNEEGIVQKVKKKISATAHANFRALKIRNKNSKGKGGKGRFGKRR